MKRFAAALLAISLVLGLSACSSPAPELQEFTDGVHERDEVYPAHIETKSVALGGLGIHFSTSAFDETASPELAQKVAEDYSALSGAGEADIYILNGPLTDATFVSGAELFCTACGARWRMTGLGRLEGVGDTPSYFPHIPDWYEWERRQVEEAIAWGAYEADFRVRVQALPNAASFVELGEGRLHHGPEGFTLTFTDRGGERALRFPARSTFSLHPEYDHR